jgi:hypothetical protein
MFALAAGQAKVPLADYCNCERIEFTSKHCNAKPSLEQRAESDPSQSCAQRAVGIRE